jgi:uncharacterized protein (TIGR04255 family)
VPIAGGRPSMTATRRSARGDTRTPFRCTGRGLAPLSIVDYMAEVFLTKGPLSKYTHPPVSELAVGIEIAPIAGLTASRLIRFHERVRDRLPVLQEQHPLPPSQPLPGTVLGAFPTGIAPQIQVEFGAPALRVWMLTTDQHLLLQLQRDRLVLNWRKGAPQTDYPSYAVLKEEYARYWGIFRNYLRDENLPAAVPLTAEVTFVNEIASASGRSVLLGQVPAALGQPSALSADYTFDVTEPAVGVGICTIRTASNSAAGAASLAISTRVAASKTAFTFDTFAATLDYAHDVGVRAFKLATPDGVQRDEWGRIDE